MRRTLLTFPLILAVGCAPDAPTGRLRVSGHVEATEVRLGPDAGGRVLTLDVKEGDRVTVGQQILTLDRRDAELSLARARAEHAQADAQLRLLLAGARPEDVRQAESQVNVASTDVPSAKVELLAAEQDLDRFETLLKNKSGSQKQRDDAMTRRDMARDRVASAESRVKAAEETVRRVKAGARTEEVQAARARLAAMDAQIATINKLIGDARLLSPVAGIVTEKLIEAGEIMAPRAPAVVIVDLDHAWADVFVPEPLIPTLKLGQVATIFTDAGGAGLPGTISYISPKAEFTPRNVQTADERSKLVYRIRVAVDNKDGILKQGMPVEAELK